MTPHRTHGFTLVEMLVVFGVFAMIGVVSSQIVSRVVTNQQVMAERGERLAEVQRAMYVIQRDLMQLANRPVRDELGEPIEALRIGANGLIELTRLGWRNPLAQPRAELQRVAYLLEDGDLYRAYWLVLDRAADSEPRLQNLLRDVERIEFFAIDRAGNEYGFWPNANAENVGAENANTENPMVENPLVGILMRVEIAPFGTVERLWPVPGVR